MGWKRAQKLRAVFVNNTDIEVHLKQGIHWPDFTLITKLPPVPPGDNAKPSQIVIKLPSGETSDFTYAFCPAGDPMSWSVEVGKGLWKDYKRFELRKDGEDYVCKELEPRSA